MLMMIWGSEVMIDVYIMKYLFRRTSKSFHKCILRTRSTYWYAITGKVILTEDIPIHDV